MCKNTRISGLQFGLIASLLNMSTSSTLYSEMPWVIFCCRDDKDVKILPGNILSEGKKMRTSWEIVLQFWIHSRYWLFFTESRQNYLCCVLRNREGSGIFFREGCTRLLLYFNTNKPHRFFGRIRVVLENRRSSQGGGGAAHPLHPPPRSAPAKRFAHTLSIVSLNLV